jgi:hypothetical protein
MNSIAQPVNGSISLNFLPKEIDEKQYLRFNITLSKNEGTPMGAALKQVRRAAEDAVLVISIADQGALREWNDQNPSMQVRPGDRIVAANDVRDGVVEIASELWQPGTISLEIERDLSKEWEIEHSNSRSFLVEYAAASKRLPMNSPIDRLQHTCASAFGASECAVCLESYSPEERVVVFPCSHAFHPLCAARWLTQGCSKRCPLCNTSVAVDQLG